MTSANEFTRGAWCIIRKTWWERRNGICIKACTLSTSFFLDLKQPGWTTEGLYYAAIPTAQNPKSRSHLGETGNYLDSFPGRRLLHSDCCLLGWLLFSGRKCIKARPSLMAGWSQIWLKWSNVGKEQPNQHTPSSPQAFQCQIRLR